MKAILITIMLTLGVWAAIDINSANAKELEGIKGVGAKTALAIVEYRKTNGCFGTVEELIKVRGIGDKLVTKNKDAIVAGPCKK
ncbi:MAG: hypothetical protein KU28_00420 [Sulfurovum sp. PC08-66]|nr:MAG: hypothetical protein KU28_00420 [Sulfurovum sp. PC08-66]KIM12434.1 MAG: hypothetical protein KU37_00540 [Sulfuricurvum sp. PC08-66]